MNWDDFRLVRAIAEARSLVGAADALGLNHSTVFRRLGQIELSLGNYDDALAHLQAAYAADPGSRAARQLLGEAAIATGDVATGTALWAGVNDAQGQLALRAFWYEYLGDEQRLAWVRAAMQ